MKPSKKYNPEKIQYLLQEMSLLLDNERDTRLQMMALLETERVEFLRQLEAKDKQLDRLQDNMDNMMLLVSSQQESINRLSNELREVHQQSEEAKTTGLPVFMNEDRKNAVRRFAISLLKVVTGK